MLSENKLEQILQIHGFLPGRKVTLISTEKTISMRWSSSNHKHLIGKTGYVKTVHEDIHEAIKVDLNNGEDIRFWHFEDLKLQVEEIPPVIIHFDPSFIDI
jgi:hypothetical protein